MCGVREQHLTTLLFWSVYLYNRIVQTLRKLGGGGRLVKGMASIVVCAIILCSNKDALPNM